MKLKNKWYTTQEATDLLGLSSSSITRAYISDGYLEAVKVEINGRDRWLISRESLQDKLNRQARIDKKTDWIE